MPNEVFDKASNLFDNICVKISEKGEDWLKVISDTLINQMPTAIFGSNYIERAGLGLQETIRICEQIFHGEVVDPEQVPESQTTRRSSSVLCSRRSMSPTPYIVNEMIGHDKPLPQDIILRTHAILTQKIDAPGGTPWREYSGRYRNFHVHVGATNFVVPNFVSRKMQELVTKYNDDIQRVGTSQVLDPFTLATKYCNDFVMIHPFLDGNGRICRLILNFILLKYAGVVVYLGEHDESRSEYMEIQKRAGERMERSGELTSLVLHKATGRYRTFEQKLTGKKMGE